MNIEEPLEALTSGLGEGGVLTAPDLLKRYFVDQRDLIRGSTPAVLRPTTVEQVAAIVRIASARGFGLVPHGGNTGYCGGATPDSSGLQFVLSLERMNRIREVDPLGFTISVDAGAILADAQSAAAAAGLMLPLSLGSEGSCRIGGNIATNAGGLSVLRYGMTRDLLLGIEAVLPDGSILSDMKGLRKTIQVMTSSNASSEVTAPSVSSRARSWSSVPPRSNTRRRGYSSPRMPRSLTC
jgi:FAD/FMN-containing dehydrogenase